MLKPTIYIAALLCISILSGCSHHAWNTTDVDSLISQQQYVQALEIEEQKLSGESSKKTIIKQKAKQYRIELAKKIQHHIRQKQWAEADHYLRKAETQLPYHKSIQALRERYYERRSEELRRVETRLALAEANYLIAKQQFLAFELKDQTSHWRLKTDELELKHARMNLSEKLMELSISALAAQDYRGAEVTFNVATQLNAELNKSDVKVAIDDGLTARTEQAIQFRLTQLLKKMELAEKEKNFKKMQSLIAILTSGPFKGQDVSEPISRATQLIHDEAQALDKKADSVYRRGNISQAIELWREAKELVPDLNGLQDKLSRAVKVQNKLDTLRKS